MALGPRPEGDVAGMRALAGQIKAAAQPLGAFGAVQMEADTWQSPRAEQARGLISGHVGAVSQAAGELGRAATLLTTEAAELEREQKAWDRAKEAEEAAEERAEKRAKDDARMWREVAAPRWA